MQLDQSKVVKKEHFNFILNGASWATREKIYHTQEGGLLVPLRPLCEKLGYKVQWSQQDKAVEVRTPYEAVVLRSFQGRLMATKSWTGGWASSVPSVPSVPSVKGGHETDLTTVGILKAGRIYVPVTFFSEILGGVAYVALGLSGSYVIIIDAQRPSPVQPGIRGEISEILTMPRGVQIRVKGEPYGAFQLEDLLLSLDRTTKILEPMSGATLQPEELHTGMRIMAHYSPDIGKGIPVVGQALLLEVLKGCDVLEGKIYDIVQVQAPGKDGQGLMARVIGTDDYNLVVSRETVLMGTRRELLTKEQLKTGMSVKVYRSEISTPGVPPVSKAFHIQLQKPGATTPSLDIR